jgi:hypothetical protein
LAYGLRNLAYGLRNLAYWFCNLAGGYVILEEDWWSYWDIYDICVTDGMSYSALYLRTVPDFSRVRDRLPCQRGWMIDGRCAVDGEDGCLPPAPGMVAESPE